MPFGSNDASACKNAEVRRHGVLRHIKLARDFTRRHAIRLMPNQQAEHVETRTLCKCPKSANSRIVIHISSIADIWNGASRNFSAAVMHCNMLKS